MTDEQVRDVRDLTRLAGIKPTTTKVNGPGHPLLEQLAPGVRSTPGGLVVDVPVSTGGGRSTGGNAQRKRARKTGETNGQSRRGNPTSYTSESPERQLHGRRPASSLRRGPGCRPGRSRAVAATVVAAAAASPAAASRRGARAHSASSFSRGR